MTRRIRPATGSPRFAVDLASDAEKADAAVVQTFRGVRTITAGEQLTKNDYTVLADASAGPMTVILPPLSDAPGQTINIKKIDATANLLTIDGSAAETIDGAATISTSTPKASFSMQSTPNGWVIL